jgi:hypothetical protein
MPLVQETDGRTTPIRDGVASRSLEGIVRAEVYLDPTVMGCTAPATGIHRGPDATSEQMDQLLFGETFEVIEEEGAFVWGQARRDGYVGFVAASALKPLPPEPTHRISAIRTYAFAGPSIKTQAFGPYSMNALVAVEAEEGRLAKVAGAGWMAAEHLAPIGRFETDLAADQQAGLGREIARKDFGRGDLVFWNGHVAIGLDAQRVVHANGFHMAVAVEPLETAITRIDAAGVGQPSTYRRL